MDLRSMKEQQRETETELLEELVRSKLDVVLQEATLLARTTSLSPEEALGTIYEAFHTFIAGSAIDSDVTKEAFLIELGGTYDDLREQSTELKDNGPAVS